jgi:3'-phosphoadenosine 5'-phosphosulfate sulfotransferase (PAPS reductase)/FAD synthetase
MSFVDRLLEPKIKKSTEILKGAFDKFKNVGIVWSTGKDSTTTLFLAKELKPNILVLFGDTTRHFQETYDFRGKVVKKWNLNLVNVLPEVNYEEVKGDRTTCCRALKTKSVLGKIENLHLDAVITAVRWDENPAKLNEDYISQREEGDTYKHHRIHPLLHWTETDVWNFIKMSKIPYNPLYNKGFLSIECEVCPTPIQKAEPAKVGRERDREKIMKRLRALGY